MKFCFYGNIAEALIGKTPGGGELQVALLAKALALKGHEVVVVDPLAKESFVTKEGVRLVDVPGWNEGSRGVRLFSHRIPSLKKVLAEQKADYYYVRMRSYMHLVPYLVSRKTKGKFILAVACDLDVLSFWKKFKYEYKPKFNLFKFLTLSVPNDMVFDYLLQKSDYVTVQHSGQQPNANANSKYHIYPNIFDQSNVTMVNQPSRDYFIHVGSLTILKGADKLLELVKKLNKNIHVMIVGQPKDARSKKICTELRRMENVTFKGPVKHSEAIRLIANAKALINTSHYEGFPNIFLEAWATGVPVISLKVNPGNVIKKHGLGIYCEGNLERMKAAIESDETCLIDKNKLISYVSGHHDFDGAADRFLNILNHS